MRNSLVAALIVMSLGACGRSPTSPAPTPSESESVHDTLNAAGSAAVTDGVWFERSGGSDRQLYDDFVSRMAATIRTIAWQGIRPTARPAARFYISFIADGGGFPLRQPDEANSGRPRAPYSASYSNDQVNERLSVTALCVNSPQEECGAYDYSVPLTTPFATTAGTRYWVLIQAETSLNSLSGWSWRKGQVDNQFSTSNIAGSAFPWDFAFALKR